MSISSSGIQAFKAVHAAYRGYQDGSIDLYGDQIEAICGYSRQQFDSGKLKWTDIIIDEDKADAGAKIIKALKTDKTYRSEYRIRTRQGNITWIREFSEIICGEDGEIEFIAGHLVDVTEEKRAEKIRLEFEREVISLGGRVIPVTDLRNQFAIEPVKSTERSCIVVTGTDARTAGIMVDSISGVLNIKGSDIEDTPEFGEGTDVCHILGIAKTVGGIKILLDIDDILIPMGTAEDTVSDQACTQSG